VLCEHLPGIDFYTSFVRLTIIVSIHTHYLKMSLYASIGMAMLLFSPAALALPPTKRAPLCKAHIIEVAQGNKGPVYTRVTAFKDDKPIYTSPDLGPLKYNSVVTLPKGDSKLGYDVTVKFTDKIGNGKRDRPPPSSLVHQFDFEAFNVEIEAGGNKFTFRDKDQKKMPHCDVGGWDTGKFLDGFKDFVGFVTGSGIKGKQTLPVSFGVIVCLILEINVVFLESTGRLLLVMLGPGSSARLAERLALHGKREF
jgi:hypothetical protein